MKIQVKYDGAYPCLCMGHLEIIIDGKKWDFGKNCLGSGGSTYFTNDYQDSHVEYGEWEITEYPINFPDNLKQIALNAVNEEIPHGCCGGCL